MRRVHRVLAAEARQRDDGRPLTIDLHSGNNLLEHRYGRVSPALQVAVYHPCICSPCTCSRASAILTMTILTMTKLTMTILTRVL